MTESHVQSALVEKRARVDGLIRNRRYQIMLLEMEMSHLDAVIKMFNASYDVEAILPKRSFGKNPAGVPKGSGGRHAIQILRETGLALTAVEIAERSLTKMKREISKEAITMMASAIHSSLTRRKDGAAKFDATTYPGKWSLTPRNNITRIAPS